MAINRKDLVRAILQSPHGLPWSTQGFGMLRLYLSDTVRLHVWSLQHSVNNVSLLHTHPWNFQSDIIAGQIINYRFLESGIGVHGSKLYNKSHIRCGENGGIFGGAMKTYLTEMPAEVYKEGMSYSQKHFEIHASVPLDGTVSIIERTVVGNPDHATVFWARDKEFVSAEPHRASKDEIQEITQFALKRWFQ